MTTSFETYLTNKVHNGRRLSALTVKSYLQTEKILSAWYQNANHEPLIPDMLTNYDLLQFKHWSLDVARIQAATWNARRAGLAALCEWIGDAALMDGVASVDPKEASIRWLDDADYGRLMRQLERLPKQAVTAKEHERAIRDRAILSMMLFAGLRVAEVCALTVQDVEIAERSGKVIIRHGKGDKRAEIPLMSPIGRKWISEWITSAGLTGNAPLFDVTIRTAQRAVTEIGQTAGLAGLSAHDLRWTFIKRTRLGKNAKDNQVVPLEIVKKLSRHTRIETLMRYIEPSWDEMEAAVSGM